MDITIWVGLITSTIVSGFLAGLIVGQPRKRGIVVGMVGGFMAGLATLLLNITLVGFSTNITLLIFSILGALGLVLVNTVVKPHNKPNNVVAPSNIPSINVQKTVSKSTPRPARGAQSGNIFVSYRRSDSAFATGRIYDLLANHFGKELIFKDVDSIPLGLDFRHYLNDVVGKCNILLAVIGADWVSVMDNNGLRRIDDPGDFVRIEVATALNRNIPVVPLLVGNTTMPKESDLPDELKPLAYRNAIQIRNDPDFHTDMERLIRSLEKTLQAERVS